MSLKCERRVGLARKRRVFIEKVKVYLGWYVEAYVKGESSVSYKLGSCPEESCEIAELVGKVLTYKGVEFSRDYYRHDLTGGWSLRVTFKEEADE